MAKPGRATQGKRNREIQKRERKQEKEEQRVIRKGARAERAASVEDGIDPDLIGIVPGPQPREDDEF
ncbi:MAG: hypothetical protein A2X94_02865 [Bdellovibrionales bacterium GWB1_55_8]|nr:MAG: hypothetical protein A2X94_02865 [Bdellovibrionales bacterium GWB1_55_8]